MVSTWGTKLNIRRGETSAAAVFEAFVAWNIANEVKCVCVYTISVSIVPRNDACLLLEQKLDMGDTMLWCACRHHILEKIMQAVVVLSLCPSKGPDIMIFKRLVLTGRHRSINL